MASNALKYKIEVLDKASKELKHIAKEMGLLDTKTKKAKPSLDKMAGSLMKYAKGGVITAAVIGGIRAMHRTFTDLTNAYKVQEQAEARLAGALRATGMSVQGSLPGLTSLASELQSVTLYGDEATISAESLLVSIGGLDRDGVSKILPGIMDLATAMGMDLNSAASLVAKTVNSSMNALSRYGIQIDTTGTKSEKLAELTEVLNDKFGGMAEAAGKTATGEIEQLSMAYGDLKEQMGRSVAEGFRPVTSWLTKIIEKMTEAAKATNDYNDAAKKVKAGTASLDQKSTVLQRDLKGKKETYNYLSNQDPNSRALPTLMGQIVDLTYRIQGLKQSAQAQQQTEKDLSAADKKKVEDAKLDAATNKRYVDQWQIILKIQEGLKSPLQKEADALLEQMSQIQLSWGDQGRYETTRVELLKKLNGEYEDIMQQIEAENLGDPYSHNNNYQSSTAGGTFDPYSQNNRYHSSTAGGLGEDSGIDIMAILGDVGEALSMALPVIMEIVSMSEDYQEIIKTVTEFLGKLVTEALSPIFEVLNDLLKPVFTVLGNIVQSLNPVMLVIADVFKVIGDLLLAVIPSFGVLIELIGNQLTPILKMLVPIISIFASIMEIINPILVGFGIILDVLSRPIQFLGDLLAWLGDWLAYFGKALAAAVHNILHPFRKKKSAGSSPGDFSSDAFTRKIIGFDDYTTNNDWADNNTDDDTGDTGVGANYTAGRAITVNVQINTEVIAGDNGIRDLSLMIRDEIFAAEALGY